MNRLDSVRIGVLIIIIGLLGQAAAFTWLQVTTPSDGMWLEPGKQVWQADGVVVSPLRLRPDGLREGDKVVGVAGQSLEAWAKTIPHLRAPRPRWKAGETVLYTVVRDGQALELPITLERHPIGVALARSWSTVLFGLVFFLVTAFITRRRSRDPAVLALLLSGAAMFSATTWSLGLRIADLVGATGFWLYQGTASVGFMLSWVAALHFALLFPRPHPLVEHRRWFVPLVYVGPLLLYGGYAATVLPRASGALYLIGLLLVPEVLTAVTYLSLAVGFMIRSYRIHRDAETQRKLRWVFFGGLVSGLGGLAFWMVPLVVLGRPLVSSNALGLLALPFPLGLAVAILRYQLFDIDIIINRTLVYSSLSAILGTVYFGSVLLLQQVAGTFFSQSPELPLIVSTLAIAALFQPVRARVQRSIDRRFYRRKYDAAKTLHNFASHLRDDVDLSSLADDLVTVVKETMQPAHVSLWLREPHPRVTKG